MMIEDSVGDVPAACLEILEKVSRNNDACLTPHKPQARQSSTPPTCTDSSQSPHEEVLKDHLRRRHSLGLNIHTIARFPQAPNL